MKVLAYVPAFDGSDTVTARIDADLPEVDFNIDYAVDKADLGSMLQTEHYDAVLVVVDASARDPMAALKNINAGKLNGPLVCLMQGGDARMLFNVLSHRPVSVTDVAHTKQTGVIRALLNNAYYAFGGRSVTKTYGPIEIDYIARTIKINGTLVDMTTTEFRIIAALSSIPGVLYDRDQLQTQAYEDETYVDDRTIDSHIKRIRKKFNMALPDLGNYIQTVYGGGYKFVPEGHTGDGNTVSFGPLAIDFKGMTVTFESQRLDLTITEFMVLKTMAQFYPDPVPAERLAEEASKFGREATTETIDRSVYILSRKLATVEESLRRLVLPMGDGTFILNLRQLDARAAKAVAQEFRNLGPIRINLTLGETTFRGKAVDLTPREQGILESLMDTWPAIASMTDLAERIYGDADKVTALAPSFNKLRAKLAAANDGTDPIVNKRGVGYLLDIPADARLLEKAAADMDILTVGPWILNATRQEISVSQEGTRPQTLDLNRQQYILFSELIRAFPKPQTREKLMTAIYGDETEGKDAAFGSLFSQLKSRVAGQIGDDIFPPLRKLGQNIFRFDIDIEYITPEIMAQCEIAEIGAWSVNHTAQMFMFDGSPIVVTDSEFALVETLAVSYPTTLSTETLAEVAFGGNTGNFAACLVGLRKKLREDYKITEPLVTNIKGLGYLLNANRDELADELKATFKTAALEGFEINFSLGTLLVDGREIRLGKTELFALGMLEKATVPMSAADIAAASKDEYTDTAIYAALTITLKNKLAEAGFAETRLFDSNTRMGWMLKGRREAVLESCQIETVKKLSLNHTLQEIETEGKTASLTRAEYLFMKTLFSNPKVPLSPADMAELGRELGETVSDSTLKQVKGSIQNKLEEAGVRNPAIVTVKRSVGYYLTCMEGELNQSRINGRRKTSITDTPRITIDDLDLNTITDTVTLAGRQLETVTGGSFDILCLLARAHRKMLTKQEIALHFFGTATQRDLDNAERGIRSLRHMLNRSETGLGDRLVREIPHHGGYTLALTADDYAFVKKELGDVDRARVRGGSKAGMALRA